MTKKWREVVQDCSSSIMEQVLVGRSLNENIYDQLVYSDIEKENERCGICMEEVIDRGVLDCCNHWFCFSCIDNWAIISNLCPLCKGQFEIITCVPVYDTISSHENPNSYAGEPTNRDANGLIHGNNNALSFPSYYIDENAILCLDGNDCKVRSGNITSGEESFLDTSVACDSCDIWYHSVCVEFNPDLIVENKWYCPRCKVKDDPADINDCLFTTSSFPVMVDHDSLLNGSILVQVADEGETAVVVSRVEDPLHDTQTTERLEEYTSLEYKQDYDNQSLPEFFDWHDIESLQVGDASHSVQPERNMEKVTCGHNDNTMKSENDTSAASQKDKTCDHPTNIECMLEHTFLLSEVSASSPQDNIFAKESENDDMERLPMATISSVHSDEGSLNKDFPKIDSEETNGKFVDSQVMLEGEQSKGKISSVCGNKITNKLMSIDRKLALAADFQEHEKLETIVDPSEITMNRAKSCNLSEEMSNPVESEHADKEEIKAFGDQTSQSNIIHVPLSTQIQELIREPEPAQRKKRRLGGAFINKKQNSQSSELSATVKTTVINDKLLSESQAIIREAEAYDSTKTMQNSSISVMEKAGKANEIGSVRLKKILPRRLDNNKTLLVNEIKRELRIESTNDITGSLSKFDISDERLFAAFKAAMVKSREIFLGNNVSHSQRKTSHQPRNLGRIRENLTKKLYGTGNGKRRRGWDRIWELEFWKGRCDKEKQLKKLENHESATTMLKKHLETCSETARTLDKSKTSVVDPILSRLYLADNSVFPRKGELKPLSLQLESGNLKVESKCQPEPVHTDMNVLDKKCNASISTKDRSVTQKGKSEVKDIMSGLNHASLQTNQKQEELRVEDVKERKRKWALELLARKSGSNKKKKEESLVDKEKFPLLAQLPADMLPILPHNTQSKIPIAVRQMQLNRLVENYLKNANLKVIRRTAETEFAVADGMNKEKEIYERSNSKNVYMNLSAQALSQRGGTTKSVQDDAYHDQQAYLDKAVTEALKAAGLESDSPPGSPYCITTDATKCDTVEKDENRMPVEVDNVLNLDSNPALDIYGDFEYDLDGLELPGSSKFSSSLRIPSQLSDSPPKLKVFLSDISPSKTCADNNVTEGRKDLNLHQSDINSEQPEPRTDPEYVVQEVSLSNSDSRELNCFQKGEADVDNNERGLLATKVDDSAAGVDHDQASPCSDDHHCKVMPCTDSHSLSGQQINTMLNNDSEPVDNTDSLKALLSSPLTKGQDCSNTSEFRTGSETRENICTKVHQKSNAVKEKFQVQDKKEIAERNQRVSKKVEAYVKEHIRPLCKSGIVTVEQYRWAVQKTVEKVMKYHHKARSADFLIVEGDKVKKLSEQYLQAFKKERH